MKKPSASQSTEERVHEVLALLKARATKATLDGMARYAIPSENAYGVAMKDLKALGKEIGDDLKKRADDAKLSFRERLLAQERELEARRKKDKGGV